MEDTILKGIRKTECKMKRRMFMKNVQQKVNGVLSWIVEYKEPLDYSTGAYVELEHKLSQKTNGKKFRPLQYCHLDC